MSNDPTSAGIQRIIDEAYIKGRNYALEAAASLAQKEGEVLAAWYILTLKDKLSK